MTTTIAVVTAGLSQPSSTRLLADQLAAATDRALRLGLDRLDHPGGLDHPADVRVEVIELRDLAHAITDNLLTGFPSGDLAKAVATSVIVGRPMLATKPV